MALLKCNECGKDVSDKAEKCPTCGSTMVKRISGLNRAMSVGLFGLSSSKIGKTMECKSCGCKW